MNLKLFRTMWFIIVLACSILACNLFNQVTTRVSGVHETAEAVITDAGEGQELLATAKAILTAEGSSLLKTAAGIATQEGPHVLGTVRAFATQEGPGLIETAQAVATEKGPEVKATVQAFVTEQGPEIVATAQGLATQVAIGTPQVPEDIPLVQGERNNLTVLLGMITYNTPMPYDEVLAFYLAEMPAKGWELGSDGTYQIEHTAVLNYQKSDRKATVSMSMVDKQTYLLILIQTR